LEIVVPQFEEIQKEPAGVLAVSQEAIRNCCSAIRGSSKEILGFHSMRFY